MSRKFEFMYSGHSINVVEAKSHWEVYFSAGRVEKIYYHVNSANAGIWMWESGKIDDDSLSIGALIECGLTTDESRCE